MRVSSFFLFIGLILSGSWSVLEDDWGFYGHRLINETAVFTLPVDLIPLYKSNIAFIREHSIDPDKRRHSAKLEAVRHYIDLDIWGEYPFEQVPRDFADALLAYGSVYLLDIDSRDTIQTWSDDQIWTELLTEQQRVILAEDIRGDVLAMLDRGYIELPRSWMPDTIQRLGHEMVYVETFSQYGILPYHLESYQQRLTYAFKDRNWPLVLRISTELGHYLSDAHVPLHTTENYDGQLSGQDGIHAFWESRIPELFAVEDYDFFVDRAQYIEDTKGYFWDVVLESHTYVDEVLSKEKELRATFDQDQQYCYEERGAARASRVPCEAFAKAYQDAMEGMVEDRMRKSIQAIGSCWYTAWIDAGRPDLEETATLLVDSLDIPGNSAIHELRKEP